MAESRAYHVVILGSGLVSRPIVTWLLRHEDTRLTVAGIELDDARALVGDHPRADARRVDVTDPGELDAVLAPADAVVSLVPYAFHVGVARAALRRRIPLVTTSYTSPEMQALDGEARDAGVTVLNEVGLDPGIDHMSARRTIDAVTAEGGRVVGFDSCTGSLPAPEAADSPWRYKFAWSPRGALLAARQPARFLADGVVCEVPGERLFDHTRRYDIEGLGTFERYPNRDSMRYVALYGLDDARSMLRGTIRYPGWGETVGALARLGLLDDEERERGAGATYRDLVESLSPAGAGSLRERLAARLGLAPDHAVLERLDWAGLLSATPLPRRRASALDLLVELLVERLSYGPGERDMVVMRHALDVERADGGHERRIALLVAHGESGGDSATARTVSLTAAIATRRIVTGAFRAPGMQLPTRRDIYEPVLDALAGEGIRFREWIA